MGFCFGVRRAVDMMSAAVTEKGPMASLGSVVHNRRSLNACASRPGDRSRPGPRQQQAGRDNRPRRRSGRDRPDRRAGLELVDTTCPIVTRSQQWAKRLSEEGFAVIIFGDPKHKEVRGVVGWAKGKVIVVRTSARSGPSRTTSLAHRHPRQTTETEGRFSSFVRKLLQVNFDRISELRVINTLCTRPRPSRPPPSTWRARST